MLQNLPPLPEFNLFFSLSTLPHLCPSAKKLIFFTNIKSQHKWPVFTVLFKHTTFTISSTIEKENKKNAKIFKTTSINFFFLINGSVASLQRDRISVYNLEPLRIIIKNNNNNNNMKKQCLCLSGSKWMTIIGASSKVFK